VIAPLSVHAVGMAHRKQHCSAARGRQALAHATQAGLATIVARRWSVLIRLVPGRASAKMGNAYVEKDSLGTHATFPSCLASTVAVPMAHAKVTVIQSAVVIMGGLARAVRSSSCSVRAIAMDMARAWMVSALAPHLLKVMHARRRAC